MTASALTDTTTARPPAVASVRATDAHRPLAALAARVALRLQAGSVDVSPGSEERVAT